MFFNKTKYNWDKNSLNIDNYYKLESGATNKKQNHVQYFKRCYRHPWHLWVMLEILSLAIWGLFLQEKKREKTFNIHPPQKM